MPWKPPSAPKRCYLFPKTLGEALVVSAAPALGRRGFTRADVLRYWPEIVGRELAARCVPVKLVQAGGGTLYLKARSGACALEAQYAEPLILERLSSFYGFPPARRIAILQ